MTLSYGAFSKPGQLILLAGPKPTFSRFFRFLEADPGEARVKLLLLELLKERMLKVLETAA
jgi:hypothetical protein